MTIMQLLCDIQLVAMIIYWVVLGDSFRYPLSTGFLGISKILINVILCLYRSFLKQDQFKMHSQKDCLFHYYLDKIFKIPIFLAES